MIKPAYVRAMHRSVSLYEEVIDAQLEAPWPEAVQKTGRKISLRAPLERAKNLKQPSNPSMLQEEILLGMYEAAGWSVKKTGVGEWLVQFPAEKA
jgi:hypothetical protein